jgi:hypothetical protein
MFLLDQAMFKWPCFSITTVLQDIMDILMCLNKAVERLTLLFHVWKKQGLNSGTKTCPASSGFPYFLNSSWTVMLRILN